MLGSDSPSFSSSCRQRSCGFERSLAKRGFPTSEKRPLRRGSDKTPGSRDLPSQGYFQTNPVTLLGCCYTVCSSCWHVSHLALSRYCHESNTKPSIRRGRRAYRLISGRARVPSFFLLGPSLFMLAINPPYNLHLRVFVFLSYLLVTLLNFQCFFAQSLTVYFLFAHVFSGFLGSWNLTVSPVWCEVLCCYCAVACPTVCARR